jgi:hypothetical protein
MKTRIVEGGKEIGYKITSKDMRPMGAKSDIQFELNKQFEIDGPIRPKHQFHYATSLKNCLTRYHPNNGNRIFQIEASGDIKNIANYSVCSKIRFIKEISFADAKKILKDQDDLKKSIVEKMNREFSKIIIKPDYQFHSNDRAGRLAAIGVKYREVRNAIKKKYKSNGYV